MLERHLFTYTCAIICADLMRNYMEDLKDTPNYKQNIKNKCNGLLPDIENLLKTELPKIYAVNEEYVVNCLRETESIVKSLAELNSSELIEFSQLLVEYKKDKDRFLDKHQLMLKKLDQ